MSERRKKAKLLLGDRLLYIRVADLNAGMYFL
jgi:hypothetical protein